MTEIKRTIITRDQLAKYGYDDAYTISDEKLADLAEKILKYVGLEGLLKEAINWIQENDIGESSKHKVYAVTGVIVTRSILEEYGYDPNMLTDENMQTVSDELMEYYHASDGYKDCLKSTFVSMGLVEGDEDEGNGEED